jgi:hypothetical protein
VAGNLGFDRVTPVYIATKTLHKEIVMKLKSAALAFLFVFALSLGALYANQADLQPARQAKCHTPCVQLTPVASPDGGTDWG